MDISRTSEMPGFVGACLVDSDTGLMLTSIGGGTFDLEAVASFYTHLVQAQLKAISSLKLNETIEDILISLGGQFHLIRPIASHPTVFIFVVLDRTEANLGLARLQLREVEAGMAF
jgi:predicted regulator of Ras-like GTPase activity (Roadblock/LC7/MglB family)